MKQEDYQKLVDEVFGLIDSSELLKALEPTKPSERVDGVQDIIRTAIIESSIGKYKGVPYFFNGKMYERMSYDEFGNLIYDLMKKCGLKAGDFARVNGVTEVCRKVLAGKELSPDKSIMIFKNCVLDTKTRTTHRFDKKFIQMTSVDYAYDKDAYPFQWTQFLDSVLPDKREQRILQEALGCLLINRDEAKLEHITFLYGTGANGKSVVFETVMGVFGRENISNFPLMSLISGGDRKKNIATMDGLWANYSGESQEVNISKNEDAFKSLISGEPTEARQIFGENFMAYNIPLQFANINKMPVIRVMNNAVKRRIVIVDFKIEIPPQRQNKQIAKIFKKEYSGIFNWIMDGRERFIKNKYDFTEREYIDEKTDEYQATGNSVLRFMHKEKFYRVNKDITDTIPKWVYSGVLYSKYQKYCLENELTPENKNNFGAILRDVGYQRRRAAEGNQYAIYGSAVLEGLHYKTVVSRKKTSNEDNFTPYLMNGKEHINTIAGISRLTGVNPQLMSVYIKVGLMSDCFVLGGDNGRTKVFDVSAVKQRLKELNVLMTDKEREELLAIRKTEAYKRGRYNAEMKKYNSKSRLYKDPVEERLVKVRNELRRKERQLLKKEVRDTEAKLKKVESKLKE